jgi:hypothetical protein
MQEKKSDLQNEQEIAEQIKQIRKEYSAVLVDEEAEEMSFLDRLNKLVSLILQDDHFSIYQTLNPDKIKKWHQARWSRWIKNNLQNIFYFTLLATITGFLVSEALSFYAVDGIISTKTYVKAILTEVCFIFLSGYRSNGALQSFFVNLLRCGIFVLMIFVITSETFVSGKKFIGNVDSISQQITLLENQIAEKEKTINFYMEKGWGVNVRKHTDDKNELVNELLELKKQQAKGANVGVSQIEEYKMYGKAFFRVLLLLISALITRRLFKF